MIIFTDTSALVKLYIDEDGSEETASLVRGARVAVSPLAAAECYATFARRLREQLLTAPEHRGATTAFSQDWRSFLVIPADDGVLAIISDLCLRHPLRGADALQLASAMRLSRASLSMTFACADLRLLAAARAEGLQVAGPGVPPDAAGA